VTSKPPERDPERRASPTQDHTRPSGQTIRSEISTLLPWPNLGLVLSLSIVFAGNVAMSTFAWFAVEMVVR
jgi:hypothetical protein